MTLSTELLLLARMEDLVEPCLVSNKQSCWQRATFLVIEVLVISIIYTLASKMALLPVVLV